jgi:hypothetical protein
MRERESGPYASGTRASLFTLLIFRAGESVALPDPVEEALGHLLGRRPARVIRISPTGDGRTEAWVGGRCSPDGRERGVCLEEVDIQAGGDGVGADPGAWSPLLLRGLPVYAWLPDGLHPAKAGPWEAVLSGAAGLIDGLVVDSSRAVPEADGPEQARAATAAASAEDPLRGIARICGAVDGAFPIADFSWRRGRVLREQCARAFDPADMRPLLSAVTGVRLLGGSPAEARLFFRWIDGRLSRHVPAEHAGPGPLADGFAVRFAIDGSPDREIGCTRGGCLSRAGETAGYRAPSDGEMLMEAVDAMAPDPLFLESVHG